MQFTFLSECSDDLAWLVTVVTVPMTITFQCDGISEVSFEVICIDHNLEKM